jgi:drug/metabolite transporter superfamily protein YnfA
MIPAMSPKSKRGLARILAAAAVVACFPSYARADAGIAMLPVTHQTMLFFLLLVIIIEIIYLQARLKTDFRRTLIAVTTVNTATTGLGFPLTWALYSGLDSWANFPGGASGVFVNMQFFPLWVCQKAFPDLIGMRGEIWAVLGMFVILMVPGYMLTRIIKGWVFTWYDLLRYDGDIKPAILMANRLSYLLLTLTGCMLLFRAFKHM